MSNVSQIAQALQEILNERVEALAKETKFIQRVRQISGADFAQALIFGWLQEPEVTVAGLTQILQRRAVTISEPGISERFTPQAASFLERILQEVTQRQLQAEAVPIALLRQFRAVFVEDSSTISLPEQLAEVWRGCGGSTGTSRAGLKLFARLRCLEWETGGSPHHRWPSQRQTQSFERGGGARGQPGDCGFGLLERGPLQPDCPSRPRRQATPLLSFAMATGNQVA